MDCCAHTVTAPINWNEPFLLGKDDILHANSYIPSECEIRCIPFILWYARACNCCDLEHCFYVFVDISL
jgi:hypothetical protein